MPRHLPPLHPRPPALVPTNLALASAALLSACARPAPSVTPPADPPWLDDDDADDDTGDDDADDDADDDTQPADDDAGDDDTGDDDSADGPCPPAMALVADAVCVDVYEAALEAWDGAAWVPASPYDTVAGRTVRAVPAAGIVPQGYISGDEARAACVAAGKRLCASSEWLAACRGPDDDVFPYGPAHQDGACNDAYAGGHPVVDFFGTADGVWDAAHMNDPGINQQAGTVRAGGASPACVSAWGCYDLHGNLHEWVDDADGVFRGGFYADAALNGAGCTYVTTAHASSYHDYSTGFRCCADPAR